MAAFGIDKLNTLGWNNRRCKTPDEESWKNSDIEGLTITNTPQSAYHFVFRSLQTLHERPVQSVQYQ